MPFHLKPINLVKMRCSKHCRSTENKALQHLLVMVAALQVKTIGGSTLAICTYPWEQKYTVPVFLALLYLLLKVYFQLNSKVARGTTWLCSLLLVTRPWEIFCSNYPSLFIFSEHTTYFSLFCIYMSLFFTFHLTGSWVFGENKF